MNRPYVCTNFVILYTVITSTSGFKSFSVVITHIHLEENILEKWITKGWLDTLMNHIKFHGFWVMNVIQLTAGTNESSKITKKAYNKDNTRLCRSLLYNVIVDWGKKAFIPRNNFQNDVVVSHMQFIWPFGFTNWPFGQACTMVYRWLYTYFPILWIEFVSKLSRRSVSPSTNHKFESRLSVNCHDRRFHRLPTISLNRVCQ